MRERVRCVICEGEGEMCEGVICEVTLSCPL